MSCKAKTKSGKPCKNSPVEGSDYCHIKSHQEQDESKLTLKQERFCQLYVSKEFFANGTHAYAEAYDIDLSENYKTAQANSARLLSNAIICARIDELLDDAGLNDNFVDKQLLFLIQQHSDFNPKLGAIREYNKVKGRITDKVEHSGNVGGHIIISSGDVPPDKWEEIAKGHMDNMLKLVKEMKEAVDGRKKT